MHYSFCIEHNNPVEKVDVATAAEFSMLNFEFELGPHEFMCSYIQEPSGKLEFVGFKFPKLHSLDLCSWNDGCSSHRFCDFSRQKAR